MYAPQGPPAVFSSALASSVIVIAAVSRLLPPRIVSPLGLCLHIPELFMEADLRKMQENQWVSEIWIDKFEFVLLDYFV
nr:hypothetical protein [Clostridia bacterium]